MEAAEGASAGPPWSEMPSHRGPSTLLVEGDAKGPWGDGVASGAGGAWAVGIWATRTRRASDAGTAASEQAESQSWT